MTTTFGRQLQHYIEPKCDHDSDTVAKISLPIAMSSSFIKNMVKKVLTRKMLYLDKCS